MAFNGSGTFLPLSPPQYPAVTGQVISAAYFNAVIDDILNNGLSKTAVRDGQAPMSGVLKMGGNLISNVSDPAAAQDAATKAYVDAQPYTIPMTGGVTRTSSSKLTESLVNVTDFASAAARTSFSAFDGIVSAQPAFDAANQAAFKAAGTVNLAVGKYPVVQVNMPFTNTPVYEGCPLQLFGSGVGNPFVIADSYRRGTVIVGTDNTKAPLVVRADAGQPTHSAGGVQFRDFRVEGVGNAGVPLIDLQSFYGPCTLRNVSGYQSGVGDGLRIGYMATGAIENGYFLGQNLYAAGTYYGTGVSVSMTAGAGLQNFTKLTSRGWAVGYQLGVDNGNSLLTPMMTSCEVSVCTDGIIVANVNKNTIIDGCYFEGVVNRGVVDNGQATCVRNGFNELLFNTGSDINGPGSGVSGGMYGLKTTGATGVKLGAVGSAYGNYVIGTYFAWGGNNGTNTAKGIEISAAANPRITIMGNNFNPTGLWTGTGSAKVSDLSYSYDHGGVGQANGSGAIGYVEREDGTGQIIPCLSRGAINLRMDPTTLTSSSVDAAGSLTLGVTSVQQFLLSSALAVPVARFKAPNLPDKTGTLWISGGYVRINNGFYIQGIDAPIIFCANEVGSVSYQVVVGANAQVLITGVQYGRTGFTVVELATIITRHRGALIATNGRQAGQAGGAGTGCPVWCDGTNWRTFYDNTIVAA